MKNLVNSLLTLIFIINSATSLAQNSYSKEIEKGDKAFLQQEYEEAIRYYVIADVYAKDSEKDSVKNKMKEVYIKIRLLRQTLKNKDRELTDAKEMYNQQKIIAENKDRELTDAKKMYNQQKIIADSSTSKTNRFIEALYFYDNKFALVHGKEKLFFINKNGYEVKKLQKWDEADVFSEQTGFAKVKKDNEEYYLDTLGRRYKYCNNYKTFTQDERRVYKVLDLRDTTISFNVENTQNIFRTRVDLEILMLNNVQINSEEIPANIGNFRRLKYIQLSNSNITSVTQRLTTLDSLEVIKFINCRINRIDSNIRNLENLKELNLSGNKLSTLEENVCSLSSLEVLDLSGNSIKTLSIKIGNLSNLKVLNLRNNSINALPEEIGKLSNLRILDLRNNPISEQERENIKNLPLSTNCKIIFENEEDSR